MREKRRRMLLLLFLMHLINWMVFFASIVLSTGEKLPKELIYYPHYPLHMTRQNIVKLLQGCEEFVELIFGVPINVRSLRDYHLANFNHTDVRMRQMYHVGEIEILLNNRAPVILPAISPQITYTIYDSLARISGDPVPNLFFCVDQCENILEQLYKFKLLEPLRQLSKDQILAVLLYIFECTKNCSDTLPYLLNKSLVKRNNSFEQYLMILRSAFSLLQTTNQTVYRGIFPSEESSIYLDPIKQLTPGCVFQWSTYSRCTPSLDLAKTYATIQGIIIEIEYATTLSLVQFGHILSEDELLLSPNATYRVKQRLHKVPGGFNAITLEAQQTHPF